MASRDDALGPMGERIADVLGRKAVEAIEEWPSASPAERVAVARAVAATLEEFAKWTEEANL